MHILNPVQISARGMDPAVLKARYGRDLVFWGGGLRCPARPAHADGAAGRGGRPTVRRHPHGGRRLRVQQRPQHPGGGPGRERPRAVRHRLRVRALRDLSPRKGPGCPGAGGRGSPARHFILAMTITPAPPRAPFTGLPIAGSHDDMIDIHVVKIGGSFVKSGNGQSTARECLESHAACR